MRSRLLPPVLAVLVALTALAGCGSESKENPKTLVVATHDSWAMSKQVLAKFKRETGITVKVQPQGDAGELTNKLVLTKDSPLADGVYGIDNTFASRAVDAGILTPYAAKDLPTSAKQYQLEGKAADDLTPIDTSDVCLNIDDTWFAKKKLAPPKTLDDLTKPAYKGLFVTPGATTSSPGLAFLIATIVAKGDDGWQDYWKQLMANGAKITSGWTDAYEVDFTAGGGNGDRPIVTSYSSSPPFTIPDGGTTPTTSASARLLLPPGGVRRGAEGVRQPRGDAEVHRLHARAGLPEGPAGQHVRLPGRHLRRPAEVVGGVRQDGPEAAGHARRRDRRAPQHVAARLEGHHQPVRNSRKHWHWGTVAVAAVPLAALLVFFVYPVAGMLARGCGRTGTFDPSAVVEVLGRPRVHRVLWFTVWSAGLATLISVVAGLPVAFVLHRFRFPGRDVLRALVVVPFVLPTVVVGVAFRQLIAPSGPFGSLGLDGTAMAIVAALVFFNISVVVRTVGAFWEAIDPRREQAAAVLGASPWQVFRTVTLPALLPGIISAASVVFLFCATSFGVVLTMGGLRYANVETEIYLLTTQELDLTGGGGALDPAAAGDHRVAGPGCSRTTHPRLGRPHHQPAAATTPAAPARPAVVRPGPGLPDGAAGLARPRLAASRGHLGARELPRSGHDGRPQRAAGARPPRACSTR